MVYKVFVEDWIKKTIFFFQLPTTIADNAGYDSAQLVSELRALHTAGKHTMGLSK